MAFAPGTLVCARGRDWVVLSDSDGELLTLRPLGGRDDEVTGILTALEEVGEAVFPLPEATDLGDERSARLLRDALRLGQRSSAGPFRCFGSLGFDPRAYQLVPLLMALRLDPVRLLIADDVGTGKTASALLVAAELLSTGEASRLAVLCPPHLARQWQEEMQEKFHLASELVLPATASRLERGCGFDETVFERYEVTVVSTDFIKSDRRRAEFLRTAPELIIVDEAHTCAASAVGNRARHQRHELVKGLSENKDRHMILVTATPHSGNEDAFRSLLTLLDPEFSDLPDDLSGRHNEGTRRRLARHFVQRRRGDLRHFMDDTGFPGRVTREATWSLNDKYRTLFDEALSYATELVSTGPKGSRERRVRWWSALGLLRAAASSPAAAAATLRKRASTADLLSTDDVDDLGSQLVLDLADDEDMEGCDEGIGADVEAGGTASPIRRRLLALAETADTLRGAEDPKLGILAGIVRDLLGAGFHPIVFCKYIATAQYVAEELRTRLARTEVEAVTGAVPASERPGLVDELSRSDSRVLVATDCLSEGINLQSHFDAVVHYDLSWNPTRHEQREGRVDRLGQPVDEVRVVTLYGTDNRMDRLVLDILLRKHEAIRESTGVSVPIPGNPSDVVEALARRLFGHGGFVGESEQLAFEGLDRREQELLSAWEAAAIREKRSRTVFAQEAIKPEEVVREVTAARQSVLSDDEASRFVADAVVALGGTVSTAGRTRGNGTASVASPLVISLTHAAQAVRDAVGGDEFTLTPGDSSTSTMLRLSRSNPFVSGLAGFVMDSALDPLAGGPARRCGVIRTADVEMLTVLLLVRYRFDLVRSRSRTGGLLVEDCEVLGFSGSSAEPEWHEADRVAEVLGASSTANVTPEQARGFAGSVLADATQWSEYLASRAQQRADELLDAHQRVRSGVGQETKSWQITPYLPPDVLGIFLYVPGPA